jgi:hypothetical protein
MSNLTPVIHTEWEGPTIRVSPSLQTQACLVHAETYDADLVIASMPGGAAAGWTVPPVWQNSITVPGEGDQPAESVTFTTGNPRINKQNEKMWLLVRNIEC